MCLIAWTKMVNSLTSAKPQTEYSWCLLASVLLQEHSRVQ